MEFRMLIAILLLSPIAAYFLMKVRFSLSAKLVGNALLLLAGGALLLWTEIQETSFLIYLLLAGLTLLGLLMRLLTPPVFNLVGRILSKITKQPYTRQSYDELMRTDQPGNRMYFCVLLFTTVKFFLILAFCLSCFPTTFHK